MDISLLPSRLIESLTGEKLNQPVNTLKIPKSQPIRTSALVNPDSQPFIQEVTLVSPSGATLLVCEVLTLGELRDNVSIETGIEDPILVIQWSGKMLDHDDDTVVSTVLMRGLPVVVHSWKTIAEGN
jgi:hypothetical protein